MVVRHSKIAPQIFVITVRQCDVIISSFRSFFSKRDIHKPKKKKKYVSFCSKRLVTVSPNLILRNDNTTIRHIHRYTYTKWRAFTLLYVTNIFILCDVLSYAYDYCIKINMRGMDMPRILNTFVRVFFFSSSLNWNDKINQHKKRIQL